MIKRTDLASEAHKLWQEGAKETSELAGVKARTVWEKGFEIETVNVLDEAGETALSKPKGTYISMELTPMLNREEGAFNCAASFSYFSSICVSFSSISDGRGRCPS